MQKKFSRLIYFIVCFVFFIICNFYASNRIIAYIQSGHAISNNRVFGLNYVQNTGAAFSILQNSTELLIILSVIALVGIFAYIIKHLKSISMKSLFCLALLSAGIAGNMHERIVFGFVRDYFQLKFVDFPVFNVADIFINVGVIILIIIILLKKTRL